MTSISLTNLPVGAENIRSWESLSIIPEAANNEGPVILLDHRRFTLDWITACIQPRAADFANLHLMPSFQMAIS